MSEKKKAPSLFADDHKLKVQRTDGKYADAYGDVMIDNLNLREEIAILKEEKAQHMADVMKLERRLIQKKRQLRALQEGRRDLEEEDADDADDD